MECGSKLLQRFKSEELKQAKPSTTAALCKREMDRLSEEEAALFLRLVKMYKGQFPATG